MAIDEVEFYGHVANVVPSEIRLQKPVFTTGSLTFCIASAAGIIVNVERALLPTGPWTNIGSSLIGTNGTGLFQDTNPPVGLGFYRAVRP